jgi:hypothetical protein
MLWKRCAPSDRWTGGLELSRLQTRDQSRTAGPHASACNCRALHRIPRVAGQGGRHGGRECQCGNAHQFLDFILALVDLSRSQQEAALLAVVKAVAADLSGVVDTLGALEFPSGTGRDQLVQVAHLSAAVDEGMRIAAV